MIVPGCGFPRLINQTLPQEYRKSSRDASFADVGFYLTWEKRLDKSTDQLDQTAFNLLPGCSEIHAFDPDQVVLEFDPL